MTKTLNNPFESPLNEGAVCTPISRAKTPVRTIVIFGSAIIVFLIFGLSLFPIRPGVREAAYRASCQNNLRQIAIALLNYDSANGHLPPQYTVDESGRQLHSWRVLILPYLEQNELYESIDLTKPWNDPVNEHARQKAPIVFRCPRVRLSPEMTNYIANAWERGALVPQHGRKLSDFIDGTSNTVLVFEVAADRAVEWMAPIDGDYETLINTLSSRNKLPHDPLLNIALVDGSSHSVGRFPNERNEQQENEFRQTIINLFTIDSRSENSIADIKWFSD